MDFKLIKFSKEQFVFLLISSLVFSFSINAQTTVNSLKGLLPYLDDNNVNVKLAPGTYTVSEKDANDQLYGKYETIGSKTPYTLFTFSGNNSTYDFTGVTINVETAVSRAFGNNDLYEIRVAGNNNVLSNLTLTDVGSVHDAPKRGVNNIVIDGKNNVVDGFELNSTGSSPYGYGDIFGKGGGALVALDKHSGILIRGDYNTLKNTKVFHRAFGHCVFMQAANHPTIEGCYIQGEVRTSDDMLKEEGTGTLGDQQGFITTWGYKLPKGFTLALCEAGIRSYNAGTTIVDGKTLERGTNDVTVLNTIVKNTRSGCTISQGSGERHVENVTLIGNESGFAIGNGEVINCYADAAYGPIYDGGNNIEGEITLIAPENGYYNGSKCLASVTGGKLTINSAESNIPSNIRIEMGGYRSLRHQPNSNLLYQITSNFSGATLYNYSAGTVNIGSGASNSDVFTCGEVIDNGSKNSISKLNDCGEVTSVPTTVTTGSSFIPDPNKTYYIENPTHGYRIAANGNSEAPYTVSANDTSGDARWKFTQNANGSWHIDRAEGGSLPRLRTNGINNDPDMQGTAWSGTYTQYQITPSSEVSNTYYLTLTQAPELYQRLRVLSNGSIDFSKTTNLGVNPSLRFVEASTSNNSSGQVVHITKRNATGFAIDGNQGGDNAQNVYLWSENDNNVNQQWIEINRGNGYYSYQKYGTNYCIDGNQGGANGQNVYLWTCSDNNQNQHWQKIDVGGGAVKLVKRNASGFALNGGSGGADAQNVNLYDSSVTSQNIQWYINVVGTSAKAVAKVVTAEASAVIYPNPVVSTATITGAANSTVRVCDITGSVLFTKDIVTDEEQMDLSSLATGVYYVQVEGTQSNSVIKIVKQ